jgi:hypothetical protein
MDKLHCQDTLKANKGPIGRLMEWRGQIPCNFHRITPTTAPA